MGEGHEIMCNHLHYSFFLPHLETQRADTKQQLKHWEERGLEALLMSRQLLSGKNSS